MAAAAPLDLAWTAFKAVVLNKARLRIYDYTASGYYYLLYSDAGGTFESSVISDNADPNYNSSYYTDLTTNYLPYANVNADAPVDTDGAFLSRTKQTTLGWTIQSHAFEFTIGKSSGFYEKDIAGTDLGFVTMKFYELVSGVETLITGPNATDDTYLAANCIKTSASFEPTFDIDVLGGRVRWPTQPTNPVRCWAIAVPDVPANLGGSKQLVTGGRNLKNTIAQAVVLDGLVPKHLVYSATYHTNKIQLVFRHSAGELALIETEILYYKA